MAKATTIVCDNCGNQVKHQDLESNVLNDVAYFQLIPVYSMPKNIDQDIPPKELIEVQDYCKDCYVLINDGLATLPPSIKPPKPPKPPKP